MKLPPSRVLPGVQTQVLEVSAYRWEGRQLHRLMNSLQAHLHRHLSLGTPMLPQAHGHPSGLPAYLLPSQGFGLCHPLPLPSLTLPTQPLDLAEMLSLQGCSLTTWTKYQLPLNPSPGYSISLLNYTLLKYLIRFLHYTMLQQCGVTDLHIKKQLTCFQNKENTVSCQSLTLTSVTTLRATFQSHTV